MFGSGNLNSSCEVLGVTSQGSILRVRFSGIHKDGVGHAVGDYLLQVLRQHEPAAVVLDFLQFEYRFGNDIGGISQAFFRKGPDGKAVTRPCAIVATGCAAEALVSLLRPTKLLEVCGVRSCPDVRSAFDNVRARLESGTA